MVKGKLARLSNILVVSKHKSYIIRQHDNNKLWTINVKRAVQQENHAQTFRLLPINIYVFGKEIYWSITIIW